MGIPEVPSTKSTIHFYACLGEAQRIRARMTVVATCRLRSTNSPNAGMDIAYRNPNMVDQAFAQLKEAGLLIPHIWREKYAL